MTKSKTHWLKSPCKNYLGHWDLPEKDLILTIDRAGWEEVVNPTNRSREMKRVVHFKEKGYKPLICNETNAKSIFLSIQVRNLEDSGGKKIALYIGSVKDRRAGVMVDCVRVRNTEVEIERVELTPDSPKWNDVKKRKPSREVLDKYYIITDEHYNLLLKD